MAEPFLFVPVRHHSPACARLIQRLFAEQRPSRVLIEGPADFNDRLDELLLPHQLPLAIYSYLHTETERSGAYYPFCVYSPEWQAIQCAGAAQIPFSFIDLPWAALDRTDETPAERYADGALRRSSLIDALCKKLHVDDFDALWDTLFEIEPDPDPTELLARLTTFCTALRTADEDADAVTASDLAREAFMRTHLAEAQAAWQEGDGPILVVTGGYHTAALTALTPGPSPHVFSSLKASRGEGGILLYPPSPNEAEVRGRWEKGLGDEGKGIALTPYSYERLDSLTGYASGMPSPGYYHALWHGEAPLPLAIGALRAKKQPISTADLISAEAIAQGLAALRGHARVWRTDLLDGARSALVKDTMEGEVHPLMAALLAAFRGGERGKLAAGTRLPPLTIEIQEALRLEGLLPDAIERTVSLDLLKPDDRGKSQLLHQLVGLRIPGLTRIAGTDFTTRTELAQPQERWKLHWTPEFEGACIEAALYGATLPEAARARLTERAEHADRDAEAAALLRLEAAQMGLELSRTPLITLLRAEGDFARLARALGHLLYLYRFDEALGTAGTNDLAALLEEAFERGVWLLTGVMDGQKSTLEGIARLVEVWRRCQERLLLGPLRAALHAAARDRGRAPALRGAAAGALWSLGHTEDANILELVRAFAQPEQLGDFLTGLFTLAREAARSTPELMLRLDDLLLAFSDEDYLAALPSLRLAFSFFPPREKHQLAQQLLTARGDTGEALPALVVSPELAAANLAREAKLFALLERFILPSPPAPSSPTAPSSREEGLIGNSCSDPLPSEVRTGREEGRRLSGGEMARSGGEMAPGAGGGMP